MKIKSMITYKNAYKYIHIFNNIELNMYYYITYFTDQRQAEALSILNIAEYICL